MYEDKSRTKTGANFVRKMDKPGSVRREQAGAVLQ
jgi:hypothetical protein